LALVALGQATLFLMELMEELVRSLQLVQQAVAVVQVKTLMEALVVLAEAVALVQTMVSQAVLVHLTKVMVEVMVDGMHALVVAAAQAQQDKMVQIQVVLQIMEMVWAATVVQAFQ
jgi:hypothetical protein